MVVTKRSWLGGMNRLFDITKLGPDEYWLITNARVRLNGVEAISNPLDVTGNLSNVVQFQEIIGAGDLLLAFADGSAYYKTPTGDWQLISQFAMGSTATRCYAELVPGSTVNYMRTATGPQSGFTLSDSTVPTRAAVIVMDGARQAWVIFPDGSARVTNTYAQWTSTNLEYVPVATKPMFYNGVLYAIAKDSAGRETQIVRSCTGQPLNFVIAVTNSGQKTNVLEATGGALALAHNIGYEELTCLKGANTSEGAFIASSKNKTTLVYPDTNNLIYGEPQFSNQDIAQIGALNADSIVDVLGTFAVVHDAGIRSFDGIVQFRYEGKNEPFSAPINDLLEGITQTSVATGTFDNYAFFAVQTIYGYGVLVYDMLLGKWVSLDLYPGMDRILKFASVLVSGVRYIYAMTQTKIWQLFGGSAKATASVYGAELIPQEDYDGIRIDTARLTFNEVETGGFAEVSLFVDGALQGTKSNIIAPIASNGGPTNAVPYGTPISGGVIAQPEFNFQDIGASGSRTGMFLRFNSDGVLTSAAAKIRQDKTWPLVNTAAATVATPVENFIIIGDDGVGASGFTPEEYANRVALQARMQRTKNITKFIGTGDHAYDSGTLSDVTNNLAPFWGNVKDRCAFVPGNHDNDTASGQAFFEWFAKPRYNVVSTENVDIFLVNTGFNSAGTQTELDNAGVLKDSVQFQWLRAQLAASTKKHKWVVWHHPPVCSGVDYYPGVTPMQAIPLKSWGATALFCGHSHIVERLTWDDIPLIISGAGGRDFRAIHDPVSPYSDFAAGDVGAYWEVEATALSATYVCKRVDGTVLDRYFQIV